jgi:hypothetical protein
MEVTTKVTEDFAEITIKLQKRIGKRMENISITDPQAREILLEKHPGLDLSLISERVKTVDNNDPKKLEATWKFPIVKKQEAIVEKEAPKKIARTPKTVLTFKPKTDIVVETTEPAPEQIKGVEEPTE